MNDYSYPALITSLATCLYLWTIRGCASARRQHRVAAPAVTGHPDFERRFRIQQNTLEQLMLFIPSLWIFSLLVSPVWSAVPGAIFLIGRTVYVVTYARIPEWRRPGFAIGTVSSLVLLVGGLAGALSHISKFS